MRCFLVIYFDVLYFFSYCSLLINLTIYLLLLEIFGEFLQSFCVIFIEGIFLASPLQFFGVVYFIILPFYRIFSRIMCVCVCVLPFKYQYKHEYIFYLFIPSLRSPPSFPLPTLLLNSWQLNYCICDEFLF